MKVPCRTRQSWILRAWLEQVAKASMGTTPTNLNKIVKNKTLEIRNQHENKKIGEKA
jgi:hypothetical protein